MWATRILFAVLVAAAASHGAVADARRPALVIPQVAAAIHLDGEVDELAWRTPARTGAFVDAQGGTAAPYSDARFLRDDHNLYLALYAADEDIRSTDEFVVELSSPRGHVKLRFTAAGTVLPVVEGAHVAVDVDGSVDKPGDDDEEWVIEASLPLTAIPFAADGTVTARVSRCDLTKDNVRRCGSWNGKLARR